MDKHKSKRNWHAGKPTKKPGYNAEAVTEELLEAVVNAYEDVDERGKHPSLQAVVEELDCGLNPMKVRKLLLTAGEAKGKQIYKSVMAERVAVLRKEGKSVEEMMSTLGLSRASVHSYLPYTKIIYKLDEAGGERSVDADRMKVCRERKKAVEELETNGDVWKAVVAFQGYVFKTSKGLKFSYKEKGGELFFSHREKSITKATAELAYQRALEMNGEVEGPKKLGVFGASYLYSVFVRLGVITEKSLR